MHQDHNAQRWHDVEVALLPKPNKPLTEPGSLRPMSLLPPYAKVLARLIAHKLQPYAIAAATDLGQFAYLPARQATDAPDRAFAHCDQVRKARKASGCTIWIRKAGQIIDLCTSGITLSLHLQWAFDTVPRSTLRQSLQECQVPAELIELILFLYENARYVFRVGEETSFVQHRQGIGQGCGMAPAVWPMFSLYFAKRLEVFSPSSVKTLFADDFLLQWFFHTQEALPNIPLENASTLELLRQSGMQISLSKTVILHSWWGTRIHAAVKPLVHKTHGKRYLRLMLDPTEEVHLPLVSNHRYLGVVLAYKNFELQSVQYRLQQSWIAFNRLSHSLKNRQLSTALRLQLYNSVCYSTACYGLTSSGLNVESALKFKTDSSVWLCAIIRFSLDRPMRKFCSSMVWYVR